MSNRIHPTAIIEDGVVIGDGCDLHAHVVLRAGTVLGDRVTIHPGTVVGGEPQSLGFDSKIPSGVRIGPEATLRENVTINRASAEGRETVVGPRCFLMAGSHVAHDCALGEQVVLANNALLAGHITVGDHSFIGGGAAFHQFTRIGESAMVGGLARITRDVPCFSMVVERDELIGLNLVGLRRRGFPREVIVELKQLFREFFEEGGNPRERALKALEERRDLTEQGEHFVRFLTGGKRGFVRPRRHPGHARAADDE